ncbi:formylglycine-generating enzyme family protein [Candidatus Neomarinimicrobiota bacterium]
MVPIKGGLYLMGDSWNYSDNDALPAHLVKVDSFLISKYEITVEQYENYARSVNIDYKAPKEKLYPVTDISWEDAKAFCEWCDCRLPTESEWEYAARSGGKMKRYSGTNSLEDEIDLYAVHLYNSNDQLHKVGTKKPNELGIYDLTGNVFEWIGQYYSKYKYQDNNFVDLNKTRIRIIRGGCYNRAPVKTYERRGVFSDQKSSWIGFRCAKSIE